MKDTNNEESYSLNYKKLLIFGEEGSGKSSLVAFFNNQTFNPDLEHTEQSLLNHQIILSPPANNTNRLALNVFEVLLTNDLMTSQLLPSMLYQCECALFLIDIDSDSENFTKVKQFIQLINPAQYPLLTCIIVPTKLDRESTREISHFEISQYTELNPHIQLVEISLMTNSNTQELLSMIHKAYSDPTPNPKCIKPNRLIYEDQVQEANFDKNTDLITFRIILLGDSSVGKTSFFVRYFRNAFTDLFLTTIGICEESKYIHCLDKAYRVQLWDTAGQEKFRSLPRKYYQNADGILLIFDVNSRKSFEEIKKWISEIQQNANKLFEHKNKDTSANDNDNEALTVFLIANKIDECLSSQTREVSREEGVELARMYNLKYYEASCKLNLNIHEVILDMIFNCYKKVNHIKDSFALYNTTPNVVNGRNKKKRKDKKCC